jgi:TonB family protein
MPTLASALIGLMLVQAAQAPAPAPPTPAPPSPPAARPSTGWPPYSILSDDDYPAAAIRAEEQGRVLYRITIGADGRVSDCTIAGSSGSAALDGATCRIMRSRARFAAARDSEGRPVPDVRTGEITWRLAPDPQDAPPPPPPPPPAPPPVTPYPGPPLPYGAPGPEPEPE